MNTIIFVAVGVGVAVLRGVGVNVAVSVDVGSAAAVCVEAAFAVCAINVLTAPGSRAGFDVPVDGRTHAVINARAVNQNSNLVLYFFILPLAHPKSGLCMDQSRRRPNESLCSSMASRLFLHVDGNVRIT